MMNGSASTVLSEVSAPVIFLLVEACPLANTKKPSGHHRRRRSCRPAPANEKTDKRANEKTDRRRALLTSEVARDSRPEINEGGASSHQSEQEMDMLK